MAAFRLARENGIPGLELDVHLSVDGRIVVVHDHFTDRVAPGQGKGDLGLEVERSTLAALRALDIGSWHSPGFAGERISLLTDVFEELGDSVYYDIEIKNRGAADYGLEAALATVLRDSAPTGRYFVSSFNPISLARFKTLSPEIATAIIWCESEELPWYLRRGAGRWIGRVDALKPEYPKVGRLSSFRWRRLGGYEVLPWTVDEPAEAARLIGLSCAGVVSNRPQELGLLPGRAAT
jgi:glycerophosphoryl diester phosphodiesterase